MAERRRLVSFGDIPSHLILEVLVSGHLRAIDLVNIELTSKVFGFGLNSSLADQAASRLCSLHHVFIDLSLKHQKELFERCKKNWKRVLRFLQSIVESSDMAETPRGKMQVATGKNFTMVIKNSKVYSCGSNEYGGLAQGPETMECVRLRPIVFPFSAQVIQVSASHNNAAFVMQSGEVFTCGDNSFSSCGDFHPTYKPKLVDALKWTPCKQVAIGLTSFVFLTREGDVYTVGENTRGQLGHGDTKNREVPKMVEVLKSIAPVVQISAGPYYVLAVTKDGSVYSFGDGSDLCLGHGSFKKKLKPYAIEDFKTKGVHIIRVCAGESHAAAIDSNGYVYTWGRGLKGALGHGEQHHNKSTPEVLLGLKNHLSVQVYTRECKTFVVVESGLVYGFGWLGHGSLGFQGGHFDVMTQPRVLDCLRSHRVVQVSTGVVHTVVITQQGRLMGFGDNSESQLGQHSTKTCLVPTEIFLNS